MFAAPGIAAYFFYQHPHWLGASKVNKGILLSPPVALDVFEGKSKWKIVFIAHETCKQSCLDQLNMLARVRLALGRKLYQVDECLVLDPLDAPLAEEIKPLLKEQDIRVVSLTSSEMTRLTAAHKDIDVFIVNPDNYLILGYKAGENPDDVYKDLKLLLSTTENKGN
jgi:hypothetical protein